jgi:hypothetical protein
MVNFFKFVGIACILAFWRRKDIFYLSTQFAISKMYILYIVYLFHIWLLSRTGGTAWTQSQFLYSEKVRSGSPESNRFDSKQTRAIPQ